MTDLIKLIADLPSETRDILANLLNPSPEKKNLAGEPIAIVGMSCRFPGGANNPEAFWELLIQRKDAVTEVPSDRWNIESYYDIDPIAPGKMNSRWGGFLSDIQTFDAQFFGISPREAIHMDPQQRILLEVAWEALENAGIAVDRLAGSQTGVFIGAYNDDYSAISSADIRHVDAYVGLGGALSVIANRLSYLLDLHGPSMAIDTACSSSLVALHLACQSLRNCECNLSVVGGVNVIIEPTMTVLMTKGNMLSSDGKCKTFDAGADGIVRGEGCGVVVLKRLADARADGDKILAIIRGTAVNQDGRSNGLTAPNVISQQDVIHQALKNSSVKPEDISYIETHGTGTMLGDPIEVAALSKLYAVGQRAYEDKCILGAVKTNIGHLEAAAGIASLIKVILSLTNEVIPPNLHFHALNPYIQLEDTPFIIPTQAQAWPAGKKQRFAAISSFGIGGTNAHMIIEEGPHVAPLANEHRSSDSIGHTHFLPISAKNADALRKLAESYRDMLLAAPNITLENLCYTASMRRSHHLYRLGVAGSLQQDMLNSLSKYLDGRSDPDLVVNQSSPSSQQRDLVFVFAGQGTQWAGMGLDLYQREAIFRQTFDQCDRIFGTLAGWSLLAELQAPRLEQTAVVQPLLCAWQMSVAALWRSWGIEPQAVIGHSVGEIAAAQVAGILSLEEAMQVAYLRGQLMQAEYGKGTMLAVTLSAQQAQELIDSWDEQVDVVAINGPRSVVLAGAVQALDAMMERLAQMGITTRRLDVAYAFHSRQMREAGQRLKEALAGLQPRRAQVRFCSTVSGDWCQGEVLGASYWERNVAEPVHFAEAVERVSEGQERVWVEIGPHGVLGHDLIQGMEAQGKRADVVSSGKRGQEEQRHLRRALSKLYTLGYEPKWDALYPNGGQIVSLPSYPWQRERFWVNTSSSPQQRLGILRHAATSNDHPLMGNHLSPFLAPENHYWEVDLYTDEVAYLQDHKVQNLEVMPGAVYIEIALIIAKTLFHGQNVIVQDVDFQNLLIIDTHHRREVQAIATVSSSNEVTYQVASKVNQIQGGTKANTSQHNQVTHAEGKIALAAAQDSTLQPLLYKEIIERCQRKVDSQNCYQWLSKQGFMYGPSFRSIECAWMGTNEILVHIQVPNEVKYAIDTYQAHPVILDACFQAVGLALYQMAGEDAAGGVYLPVGLEHFQLVSQLLSGETDLYAHVTLHPSVTSINVSLTDDSATIIKNDLVLVDSHGRAILQFRGFNIQRLDALERTSILAGRGMLYILQWQEQQAASAIVSPRPATRSSNYIVFVSDEQIMQDVRMILETDQHHCIFVEPGTEYMRLDKDHYRICPAQVEHTKQLFYDVYGRGQPDCQGIVYLWHLRSAAEEPLSLSQILARQQLGSESLLALVQAVLQQGWRDLPPLWLATQQVYGLPGEATSPLDAPLWGLMRTVRQEHPGLAISAVDLPASLSTEVFEQLFALLRQPQQEDQWLLREQSLSVARLLPWSPTLSTVEVAPAPLLRADSAYLLSGGLGGLGLELLEWLIGQGAGMVIVLSRSAPSEASQQVLERLRAQGGHIEVRRVDVAEEASLSEVLQELRQSGPPLRGVFHLAAVLQDGTIFQQERDGWQQVQRPKVQGGWLLHQLTQQDPLEHFVLFSSVASVLGSAGQSNYAAANAFLDGLAAYRRRRGQPGLSINWGPWAQVGLAAQEEKRGKRLQMRGIQSIEPEEGLAILEKLMREPEGLEQVLVLPLNIRQWRQSYPMIAQAPFFSCLETTEEYGSNQKSQLILRKALLDADPEDSLNMLESHLQEQIAELLQITSKIDVQASFKSLGVDSLMVLELRNRLENSLGIVLAVTLIWTYPTIRVLAEYLAEELKVPIQIIDSDEYINDEVKNHASIFAEIDDLSEEEAEALLLAELLDIDGRK